MIHLSLHWKIKRKINFHKVNGIFKDSKYFHWTNPYSILKSAKFSKICILTEIKIKPIFLVNLTFHLKWVFYNLEHDINTWNAINLINSLIKSAIYQFHISSETSIWYHYSPVTSIILRNSSIKCDITGNVLQSKLLFCTPTHLHSVSQNTPHQKPSIKALKVDSNIVLWLLGKYCVRIENVWQRIKTENSRKIAYMPSIHPSRENERR